MKKIYLIITVLILSGCNLSNIPQEKEINKKEVYLIFGQSNCNNSFRDGVSSVILKSNPDAIIVHRFHPGNSIINWWDGSAQYNYYYDVESIKDYTFNEDFEVKALFWFQGESDYKNKDYSYYFNGYVSRLQEDLNKFDVNMVIVSLENADASIVRDQQYHISEINEYNTVDSKHYQRYDGTHLTQENSFNVGRDLADKHFMLLHPRL